MNGTVREWIDKAESDYEVAQLAMSAAGRPHCDAVCFHAQQCVEKLMKGVLVHIGMKPPRTHNLVALSDLLARNCAGWTSSSRELRFLTKGAGTLRYPGTTSDPGDAASALSICTRLRGRLLQLFQANGDAEPEN